MTTTMKGLVVLGGTLGLVWLVACTTPADTGGCEVDGDCANFEFCEASSGFCLCEDSNACDAQEFCNDQGRCQPRLGCRSNADCRDSNNPNAICDTKANECVQLDAELQCTLDSHCPYGAICEGQQCQAGCRANGDCGIDSPCIEGQCDTAPGACNENSFCEFGESCDLASNRCVAHPEAGTLCQFCEPDPFLGGSPDCATGASCLIDTSIPPQSCSDDGQCAQWPGARCDTRQCFEDTDCTGGATCEGASGGFFPIPGECSTGVCSRNFCGTSSCDESNPCPKGYSCEILISVPPNSGCTTDSQCEGRCIIGGETQAQGFCECLSNTDCGGSECSQIGDNQIGVCITGSTCGPQDGLLCEDLR